MIDPNFRLRAHLEGDKCMREYEKCKPTQLEYWGNLLGALVNYTISNTPDSVVSALMQYHDSHEKVRQHIKDKLNG